MKLQFRPTVHAQKAYIYIYMKIIKKIQISLFLLGAATLFISCKKEEKLRPVSLNFPNLELIAPDSSSRAIDFQDGKVRLVAFWATWCQPCLMEIPSLKKVHEALREEAFELVGISVDQAETHSAIPQVIEQYRIPYGIYLAPDPMPNQIGTIHSLPTTYLIDRHGMIIRKWLKPQTAQTFINEIRKYLSSPSKI